MTQKAHILIIGIGNPLRGDDGVGLSVARELAQEMQRADVRIVAAHQLTPEIAEQASHAETVIFIDAARAGEPGTFRRQRIRPADLADRLSHDLSPAGVLALAEKLYGRCPAAYLFTITGESFETGDRLSKTVSAAVPRLNSEIFRFLDGEQCNDES